jgi:hypothetical protein
MHRCAVIANHYLCAIDQGHERQYVGSADQIHATMSGPFVDHTRNRGIIRSAAEKDASVTGLQAAHQAGKPIDRPPFRRPH